MRVEQAARASASSSGMETKTLECYASFVMEAIGRFPTSRLTRSSLVQPTRTKENELVILAPFWAMPVRMFPLEQIVEAHRQSL
jgi:hypothetical protein